MILKSLLDRFKRLMNLKLFENPTWPWLKYLPFYSCLFGTIVLFLCGIGSVLISVKMWMLVWEILSFPTTQPDTAVERKMWMFPLITLGSGLVHFFFAFLTLKTTQQEWRKLYPGSGFPILTTNVRNTSNPTTPPDQ